MKVTEFAFVIYHATDAARARAFYEEIVGLRCTVAHREAGQFWMEFEVGPHTLGIGNEPFLQPGGGGPHLVLEVEDFEATVAHLRRHGVPFAVEPFESPLCHAAVVTDPDGNKLGVHRRKRC